jgi:hypothetical protein
MADDSGSKIEGVGLLEKCPKEQAEKVCNTSVM